MFSNQKNIKLNTHTKRNLLINFDQDKEKVTNHNYVCMCEAVVFFLLVRYFKQSLLDVQSIDVAYNQFFVQ